MDELGTGRYANLEAAGGEGCDAINAWKFEEPVAVENIVYLAMGDEMIPVN